jgi:hypothetical protein
MTDIQKLKSLAEAATPGPWTVSEEHESASFQGYVVGDPDGWIAIFGTTNQDADNADYVAASNPAAVLELVAEIERLREANKTVECRFGVSEDTLKTIRGCLASAEGDIDQLKAENAALRDAAAVAAMRIKELDLLFGRYILAMRAAVIEDEHGKTETAGMDWIFNSLAGPGQLPPEGETDAQAYFDREIVAVDKGMEEVMAFHDQRHAAKSKESRHG